jgi:PilZ domain-containing protein
MLPDDPIKAIAVVVVLVGLVVLAGSALFLFMPHREDSAPENEGRGAPRRRVFKTARIEFGGIEVDCLVRNLSATGAAIEVSSPLQCPIAFVLAIPSDGSVRHCHVVWRKGKRIGVKFN